MSRTSTPADQNQVRRGPRIAIVAAMEREVAPLIRKWTVRWVEHGGRRYKFFENGETSLVCGGIGPEAARRATEVIVELARPEQILSVGFAGALDPALKVGDIVKPRTVINVGDGVRTETGSGQGILVSYGAVAGKQQKDKLRGAYGASAVDMEAAAVARGAQVRGVQFGALKVISDKAEFALPRVEDFVAANGSFQSARFALYAAVRPWLWGRTVVLARNSTRASRALCGALEEYLRHPAAFCRSL